MKNQNNLIMEMLLNYKKQIYLQKIKLKLLINIVKIYKNFKKIQIFKVYCQKFNHQQKKTFNLFLYNYKF